MRLKAGRAPRAILEQLVCGPLKRELMMERCKKLAPGSTCHVDMKRLLDSGLMVLEYRITEAGQRALEGTKP